MFKQRLVATCAVLFKWSLKLALVLKSKGIFPRTKGPRAIKGYSFPRLPVIIDTFTPATTPSATCEDTTDSSNSTKS